MRSSLYVRKTPTKLPRKTAVPAPGRLAVVQGFLNTAERWREADVLAGPAETVRWLAARDLPAVPELSEDDWRRLLLLRGGLRAVVASHGGGRLDAGAAAELEQAVGAGRFAVHVTDDGGLRLGSASEGVAAVIEALIAIVVEGQETGRWAKLRACAAPDCGRAFYDASMNATGKWCCLRCGERTRRRASRGRPPRARRPRW